MHAPINAMLQSGYVNATGTQAISHNRYARRSADKGANFFETKPPSKPPITVAAPNEAKIQATRCCTPSCVANAGTATSKTPQPKPIKQPSNIRS